MQDKINKYSGWIASAFLLTIIFGGMALASPQEYECPVGTYPIGDGVCKSEPTGCPYGDSVPMEKCEPQTNEEKEVAKPVEPVKKESKQGECNE